MKALRRMMLGVAAALMGTASTAPAAEYLIPAFGRGLIFPDGEGFYINDPTNPYIVGSFERVRNWFLFPNKATDIISASLLIYIPSDFVPPPSGQSYALHLYNFGSFELSSNSWTHLASGPLLAETPVPALTQGTYWEVPLSEAGVAALNEKASTTAEVRIGGRLTWLGDWNYLFAPSLNAPPTFLSVRTLLSPAPPPVPEPATWVMMMLGFSAIGWTIRQRQSISERRLRRG